MNILFIANCELLYGANRSMMELAVELQNMGQNVYFFIPYQGSGESRYIFKKELEEYGFRYAFMRYFPSIHPDSEKGVAGRILRGEMNAQCLIKMKDYILKWKIDLIHTNSLTHLVGASLSRQMCKPHVWHIREILKKDYDFDYDSKLLYKYAVKRANKIICISNYVKQSHRKLLKGTSAVVLKNGFNVDKYILNGAYNRHRAEYHLLICGLIQEGKGQLEALEAVNYLVNKYHIKNIRLKIVGDDPKDYSEKLENYILGHDLQDYVEILPFQEDLRIIRQNADIALMCSRGEALGRVTIESMLSENLVIGADSGGTKEIIQDGANGYLYKCGDALDLCKKIYYAITHWEEQEKIIVNAKEYARSNYDISLYAKQIVGIYKSVLDLC